MFGELMKRLYVYIPLLFFFTIGCGTIIHKEPEKPQLSKEKEDIEEEEVKVVDAKIVFPIPPLKLPNYPYDINGFPHKSQENRTENLLFLLVSY